jgi:hypothetical protein
VSSHGSQKQPDKGLMRVGYIVTYDATLKNIWLDGEIEGVANRKDVHTFIFGRKVGRPPGFSSGPLCNSVAPLSH